MAVIVESGQGLPDADSYVSADDCLAYAGRLGLVFLDDEAGMSALRRATTWLDGTYRDRWPGIPAHGREQSLQWPRKQAADVYGSRIEATEVPREVIDACCQAAIREFGQPGILSPDVTPGRIMSSASVSGAVSVEWKAGGGIDGQRPVVTVIDDILAPLIGKRPSTTSVSLLGRS